ncbi:hypothetical protein BaRGS_00003787 [Batillaria attramentaria]|uniref:Ribosomal protein S14 n=1 Tax=Batillaria attramentaria TaxID=370345 RepID=A0ABD0M0C9_9CAEN
MTERKVNPTITPCLPPIMHNKLNREIRNFNLPSSFQRRRHAHIQKRIETSKFAFLGYVGRRMVSTKYRGAIRNGPDEVWRRKQCSAYGLQQVQRCYPEWN